MNAPVPSADFREVSPLSACTIKDTPYRGFSGWIDVSIKGPTREAVEVAVADYRVKHQLCEPRPAFYDIQCWDGVFKVNGSRGAA